MTAELIAELIFVIGTVIALIVGMVLFGLFIEKTYAILIVAFAVVLICLSSVFVAKRIDPTFTTKGYRFTYAKTSLPKDKSISSNTNSDIIIEKTR